LRNYSTNKNASLVILNGDVIVLIEDVWIERDVDLSNKLILEDIGDIPEDFDDDLIDVIRDDQNIVLTDEEDNDVEDSSITRRGVLNYDIDALVNEFGN
jgi:hypothetical protein